MLLAKKAQQQSYSGLRSPGWSCSSYLCTDSECTNSTDCVYLAYCKNRTLAVPSVRLYRLCSCNTVCAEATGSFHPTYQRAALERQCITEISGIFFHFFKIYRCVVLFFPFQYAYFWLYSWVVSMSVSSNGIELINVILFFNVESVVPSIAQLVERRTVERMKSSLGRWFESGSKEWIFLLFFRAVEYTVPALRRSYWFWEISDFVFYCNYSLVYD